MKDVQVERFSGVAALLARLEQEPKPGAGDSSRDDDRDEKWDGGVGYDGAVKLLRDGWKDGAILVSELINAIEVRPALGDVIQWQQDYRGPVFDMGEYAIGNPECCLEIEYVKGDGARYLDLYVNFAVAWMVPAAVVMARAAAVATLVEALEAGGIRCRLSAMNYSHVAHGSGGLFSSVVRVKDYDEPFHLQDAAFALGHPAMRRRISFAIDERSPLSRAVESTGHNYGTSENCTDPAEIGADEHAVIFPKIEHTDRCADAETHLFTLFMALPSDVRDLIEFRKAGK